MKRRRRDKEITNLLCLLLPECQNIEIKIIMEGRNHDGSKSWKRRIERKLKYVRETGSWKSNLHVMAGKEHR